MTGSWLSQLMSRAPDICSPSSHTLWCSVNWKEMSIVLKQTTQFIDMELNSLRMLENHHCLNLRNTSHNSLEE